MRSDYFTDSGEALEILGAAALSGDTAPVRLAAFSQRAFAWFPLRVCVQAYCFCLDELGQWDARQKFLHGDGKLAAVVIADGDPDRRLAAMRPFFEWARGTLNDHTTLPPIASGAELLGAEGFAASPLRASLNEQQCEDVLYAAWRVDAENYLLVGVGRGVDSPPFEDREVSRLGLLARGLAALLKGGSKSSSRLETLTKAFNLTRAEAEVLEHALRGMTEKQIAARVERSHHTVHSHLKRIYRRFNVSSRAELLALALEE